MESVFPGCTSAASLLWLFPSLQALHLPAFERSHAFVCHPSYTCSGGFLQQPPPPLEVGMSPPLLASTYQAGAGFAALVPWQAAIPVGSRRLCGPCVVLAIPKPRVQMQHVGRAVALFHPWLSISLPSLAQVQSLRAQLESCRARNESLRDVAKSQGDGHVPRGYISQVSRVPDMGPWGRSQSQTGKCWDSAHCRTGIANHWVAMVTLTGPTCNQC